jgi:hypothetical protein
MAGTGVAVASGELLPILDDAGAGVYTKGRNNQRDIRVDLLGSMFLVGSDGFTPRPGILVRTAAGDDLKVVSQLTPNQTVTVKKGMAVIPRTGQGAYLFVNEADQIVNMPAASAVNPRYDIVCCAAFDKGSFVGDSAHGPQFWVEQGVVSGAPVVPATPTGMLKLAEVLRAVNDNAIGTENVDKRTTTSLHNPVRILGPGDSTADAGITVGEIRYSSLSGPEIWTGALWIPIGRPSYATIAAIPAALAVTGSLVYHTGLKRMIRYTGTAWDQNYDTDAGRSQGVRLASNYTVGGEADVTGLTLTITTTAINTPVIITAVIAGNTTGNNYIKGLVNIDGTNNAAGVYASQNGALAPGMGTQVLPVTLGTVGAHIIKLRAVTSGGTSSLNANDTALSVQVVPN